MPLQVILPSEPLRAARTRVHAAIGIERTGGVPVPAQLSWILLVVALAPDLIFGLPRYAHSELLGRRVGWRSRNNIQRE